MRLVGSVKVDVEMEKRSLAEGFGLEVEIEV
jgi:hypothetical protein